MTDRLPKATTLFPTPRRVIIPIDVFTTLVQLLGSMQVVIVGLAQLAQVSRDAELLRHVELANNIIRDMTIVLEATVDEGSWGHDYTKSIRVKQ